MATSELRLLFQSSGIPLKSKLDFVHSDNDYKLYAIKNNIIYNLHVLNGELKTTQIEATEYNITKLCRVFSIAHGADLLIATTSQGIQFYICTDESCTMKTHQNFNDFAAVNWNVDNQFIDFGYFYYDLSRIGIIAEVENMVNFYEIIENGGNFSIQKEFVDTQILNQSCPEAINTMILHLKKDRNQVLVRKSANNSLSCVFELNSENIVQLVAKISFDGINQDQDQSVFFTNLSGNENWMDIVTFNSSGLFVFQYQNTSSISYNLIAYNPMFSAVKGWTAKHRETIEFADVNNNGFDELIFTGPGGIEILSYDFYQNKWKSLLNTEDLIPEQRHKLVLHATKSDFEISFKPTIICQDAARLYVAAIVEMPAEIIEITKKDETFSFNTNEASILPALNNVLVNESRSVLYLRDQNLFFDHINSINPKTGKPSFVLPLIAEIEPTIKLNLIYDGSNGADSIDLLGVGWSMSQNFILLNSQPGNFEEDETYILFVDSNPHKLKWLPTNSTDILLVFESATQLSDCENEKFKAEFNVLWSTWQIDYGTERKIFYGNYDKNNSGAVVGESVWHNWRGTGFDKCQTIERNKIWYLAATEIRGFVTLYKYEIISKYSSSTDKLYNAAALLKVIHNDFNELTFFYSNNEDNNCTEQNIHLTKYIYTTKTREQTVIFNHTMTNNLLLLNAIEQESDYVSMPVMQFKYLNGTALLENIILPTGARIVYNYTSMGEMETIKEDDYYDFFISDDYNVSFGLGFTLISYLDKNLKKIILRMFTSDMKREIFPQLNSTETAWPSLDYQHMEASYQILIGNSFFTVVIYNSPVKITCSFGRLEDGNWLFSSHCYQYSENSAVLKGDNSLLIAEPKSAITLFEWLQAEARWNHPYIVSSKNISVSVASFGNKFIMYDDNSITLLFKDARYPSQWLSKELVIEPNYLSETEKVLHSFNTETNFEKALLEFFRNNAIQIKHNLVVLSGLVIHNNQELATKIRTYVIGREHNVVIMNSTIVIQDNISELNSKEEINSKGDKFTLKYIYENKKFQIGLGTFHSPTGKQREEFAEEIKRKFNFPKAKRFLLDLNNYYVSIRGQTVMCRNAKYTFGGAEWHRSEIDRNTTFRDTSSVLLGNKFVLNKTDAESTIKLSSQSQQNILYDFMVKNISEIKINYPVYIASQGKNQHVTILEFINNGGPLFTNVTLPKSHQLSPFGNAISLITHQTNSKGNRTLFIWPMYSIRRFLPNFIVRTMKIVIGGESGGSKERITGYEYKEKSALLNVNQIFYEHVLIFPGNNQILHGHLEILNRTLDFYSGHGTRLKRPNQAQVANKQKTNNEKCQLRNDGILYDRSGRLQIARIDPIFVQNNMMGFLGFESYENAIGNWMFNRENITEEQFSLTGRNHLHLVQSQIKGIFTPKYQKRQYLASCWIRTPFDVSLTPGDIVPFLYAKIIRAKGGEEVFNALSDVKYQLGDWAYLEVTVDLGLATSISKSGQLIIEIIVSPSTNISIEVDHVRFSPLEHIFEVNVYDEEIAKPVAIIKANGAIKRFVYDKYQVQIAEINEFNQIEQFTTYTKRSTGSIGRFNNPAAVIKITSERGFYENFSPVTMLTRWRWTNYNAWKVRPNKIEYNSTISDYLLLRPRNINYDSYGLRFMYSFQHGSSIDIETYIHLRNTGGSSEISMLDDRSTKQKIPIEGEFLLLKINMRIIIWINGILCIDQYHQTRIANRLKIFVNGEIKLENLMIFSRPQVEVIYKNCINEEIQKIALSSSDTAIVTEYLYDDIGRQRITVQPVEIKRTTKQSIIAYVKDLVTNDDPNAIDSVWKTGQLYGEVSNLLGHTFGLSEIVYDDNPLNIKIRIGIPGEKFSAFGIYAQRFKTKSSNNFLQKRYPSNENFTHQVIFKPSGKEKVSVFNDKNLIIASYIRVKGDKDILSTFEYNEMGLMTKCLPPLYYANVGIFDKYTLDLAAISLNEDENMKQKMQIHIDYNSKGNPIYKITADIGAQKYIYDEKDRLKFTIQYLQETNDVESVVYFLYDIFGRLSSTGHLSYFIDINHLLNLTVNEDQFNEYQRFYYSDSEREPELRGNVLRAITINTGAPIYEESILDIKGNVISKRYLIPNGSDQPSMLSINKKFESGLLKEILYPGLMFGESFQVAYEYDMLGRMVSVGIPGQSNRFLSITYNADDRIVSEMITPLRKNKFTRSYKYNEPGFLIETHNPFLREEISYTEEGYGSEAYGDGTVTRVKFTARWHQLANSDGIGVREDHFNFMSPKDSQKCFRQLQSAGYLDENNQQTRILYSDLDLMLSFSCINGTIERKVKEVLGKYGFPKEYGYRFDYTDHMELRKAKYFVGTREPTSFQSETFAKEIPGIDLKASRSIWKALTSTGYIVQDNKGRGGAGKSYLRKSLKDDLKSISPNFAVYTNFVGKILIVQYIQRLSNVSIAYLFGEEYVNGTSQANDLYNQLLNKGYLANPIEPEFINILTDYEEYIPEIVYVMQAYLAGGRSEFDVDTFSIDSNGNRLSFHEGFKEYELKYDGKSNRICDIIYSNHATIQNKEVFKFRHDSRGNVIQALHKNIRSMEYHPVANRLERVEMTNGNIIIFYYDSKGDRAYKRVRNEKGELISKTSYLYDENGRCLVERRKTFASPDQPPDVLVTMYIYGPNSLVGFVRRDQYYSVITDHQGSVRLIVRDGEVVAAYDYMPYGELMRIYGSNPDAHILYRYTGQEWDPDIGLYNYHARFYDPSIGRFYQTDPMAQYFSPYKYAGNSPVSVVDPSGQAAVSVPMALAIVGFAAIGGYLGAAAKNDDFNPWNWNWSSSDTKMGIIAGVHTGALIPLGITASLIALGGLTILSAGLIIGVSLAVMYLSMAAANNDLNPGNWDYASPKTWYAAFEGLSAGVGIFATIYAAGQLFNSLGKVGKIIFTSWIGSMSVGSVVMAGLENDWDIDNIEFWNESFMGILSTPDLPLFGKLAYSFARKHTTKLYQGLKSINFHLSRPVIGFPNFRQSQSLGAIASSGSKMLIGVSIFGLTIFTIKKLMHSKVENWDMSRLSTYHNLLTAIQFSGQIIETTKSSIQVTPPHVSQFSQSLFKNILQSIRQFITAIADAYMAIKKITRFIRSIEKSSESPIQMNDKILLVKDTNISLIYTRNRFTNPIYMTNNMNFTGMMVRNDLVKNSISRIQALLEGVNQKNFQNENIVEWLANGNNLSQSAIDKCTTAITKLFQSNNAAQISRIQIKSLLESLTLDNENVHSIKLQVTRKQHEMNVLQDQDEKTLGFQKSKALLFQIKYHQNAIKNLEYKELAVSASTTKELTKIIWNNLKPYRDRLISWEFSNCAEPPSALVSDKPANLLERKYFTSSNSYDSRENFKYLSSDNLHDWPELLSFEKCFNCINVTSKLRNIVRDIPWLALLNEKFKGGPTNNDENTVIRKKRSVDIRQFSDQSPWPKQINRREDIENASIKSMAFISNKISAKKNASSNSRDRVNSGNHYKYNSQVTCNETLLLVDVLISKCKKRKLFRLPEIDPNLNLIEKQIFACEIIQIYEKSLKIAAKANGIKINRLDMSNQMELYKSIVQIANKKLFENISNLLQQYALEALPDDCYPSKQDVFDSFLSELNINQRIDQILLRLQGANNCNGFH